MNLEWFLNISANTITFLEENIEENLCDFRLGTSSQINIKGQFKKEIKKIDKLDFIKIKYFCTSKDIIEKTKREVKYCEKTSANHVSEKNLCPKYIKTSYN